MLPPSEQEERPQQIERGGSREIPAKRGPLAEPFPAKATAISPRTSAAIPDQSARANAAGSRSGGNASPTSCDALVTVPRRRSGVNPHEFFQHRRMTCFWKCWSKPLRSLGAVVVLT